MLVKCCHIFPEGQTRFMRYFKRAWYNRLRDMIRDEHRKKRLCLLLDLSELVEKAEVDRIGWVALQAPDHRQYHEDMDYLKTHLSPKTFGFLSELVDPGKEVFDVAWREFCRRNKLHNQGHRVQGINKFRITEKHVRKALGMSTYDARCAMREVQKRMLKLKSMKGV